MNDYDEPTLPPLPAVSWDEYSQTFSNNPRKRVRRGNAPPSSAFNSSDPAIFSSDDDPALENYTPGRHKRRYVGTWESQEPASADSTFEDAMSQTPRPKAKRTFERQKDSGVFLGSDDVDETLMETPKQTARIPSLNISPKPNISNEELQVRRRIQRSVDNGDEVIDLYGSGLKELSNDTVRPLSQLARIPIVARDVAFEHREPDIKLYLASNFLTRLPGAIFDLSNLTVLSLRSNKLRELPPSIAKLVNLQELNLAQNNLQSLPAELLDLFHGKQSLQRLVLHPNPFIQPDPDTVCMNKDIPEIPGERGPLISVNIGKQGLRSPVQRSNAESGSVPSLVEMVMRKCAASTSLEAMQGFMSDYGPLEGLFQKAIDQKHQGGLVCSQCRQTVVVPAEEWIEWRLLYQRDRGGYTILSTAPQDLMVPFSYRSCRPGCGGL